ncbi:MAG: hypothetical protein Q8Q80_06340 [Methyloversatilis sp.]|nr:hypothetical protein [Methyloversatilis sp.]MDP3872264.1 hypothetical protein [Methyloversatilis sp.]
MGQLLKRRKMIKEACGWIKTLGGLRTMRHKALEKLSVMRCSHSRPTN